MRLLPFMLIVCACEPDCDYPYADPVPEHVEEVECEPVYEGCSPDTAYCKGKYTHASVANPSFNITEYVYWIRHLNENILCEGYENCEEVYDLLNEWCREYPECWRADRLPVMESCDAVNC